MSGQIESYRKEIFNFLRTVTIKFEPFAYSMGQEYMDANGLTDPHGEWNPYYIHLSGNYTPEELADPSKLIHVWTVEKEEAEDVIFDKNLINTNPKTAALYKIPNKEYFILEERYPEYTGLIRTIAYPIPSIKEAIAAPNLSLLGYDATLLEENERESIIGCLKNFLEMVRTRWWIEEYTYEDMYASSFWAMLWQMLPLVLLSQRFKNIKSPSVHSFHIWEYLTSKGLTDYRDVLTDKQSLWLYRNIDYIQKNEGKQRTLMLLAANLLEDAYASLIYKDMYQNTINFSDQLRTNAEFRSFYITDNKEDRVEQVSDLNERLVDQGLEHNESSEYIEELEHTLSEHKHNILNTKFLELKKDTIDTADKQLMIRVYLDNLIYRLANNGLSFQVSFNETLNGTLIKSFVGDIFFLWYYATLRASGYTNFSFPNQYTTRMVIPYTKPKISDLDDIIMYQVVKHHITDDVAVKEILNSFDYHEAVFVNQTDFAESVTKNYSIASALQRQFDASNKLLYHYSLHKLMNKFFISETVEFVNFGYTSWEDFFKQNPTIKEVIDKYEELRPNDLIYYYKNLGSSCFDKIFETNDSVSGATNLKRVERIYTSVKNLFIKLGSYNITYLDNDRDSFEYIRFRDPDVIINLKNKYTYDNKFAFIYEDYLFKHKCNSNIALKDREVNTEFEKLNTDVKINKEFKIEFPIDKKLVYKNTIYNVVEPESTVKHQVIKLKFNINCGSVNCRKI